MRLFYAIEPDPDSRSRLTALLERSQPALRACGRLTETANLHVTLLFIGEWPEERLPEVIALLDKAAAAHRPFTLTLDRFGVFGGGSSRSRRDRHGGRNGEGQQILWLGDSALGGLPGQRSRPDSDRRELLDLVQILRQGAAALGIEPDTRPFFPHLTITRKLPVSQTEAVLAGLPAFEPVRIPVRQLVLMRSVAGDGGMVYQAQHDSALGGRADAPKGPAGTDRL